MIVNAAAYTNVLKAETDEQNCFATNTEGVNTLAKISKQIGATLIHFSTDYVFDGCKTKPYLEDDKTNPINIYGRSKLLGETAIHDVDPKHIIFRICRVCSAADPNVLNKIIEKLKREDTVKVVNDQIGNPT